ncbi:hypothetical protein HHL22_06595 [Hymenobacter sp. RP-2-7]|uniref:GLPGLI family protein n=1 Tax=Hymenobacter polaris TaxID=2682546 RepID=A0A7Y0ACK7_9BACT|nr:hypothetical protein [Hymenobacter polaris]NML64871.1 hypothetical protein [Hymenobacter polaris]
MKMTLLIAALAAAPTYRGAWFSGCITYRLEAHNAAGETLETSFGAENQLYISGQGYKMLAAHRRLLEVYDSQTDQRQAFGADGQLVARADTVRPTIRPVAATQQVLGYPCQAVQVRVPGVVSTVFFAPALRVNPASFRTPASGPTGALLQATGGALPLRVVTMGTAAGFTLVSEATSVQPLVLKAADFATAAGR